MFVSLVQGVISAFHKHLSPFDERGGEKAKKGADKDLLEKGVLHGGKCSTRGATDAGTLSVPLNAKFESRVALRFARETLNPKLQGGDLRCGPETAGAKMATPKIYQNPHCPLRMIQSPSNKLVTA